MKRILCVFFAIVMAVSCAPMAAAIELEEDPIVEAKRALAQEHADEYIEGYADTEEAELRNQQIDEIILKIQIEEIDKQAGIAQLESMGVYYLETESVKDENVNSSRMTSQVEIGTVMITYDGPTGNWTLTASGKWTGDDWRGDQILNPRVSEILIGGFDGVGLCFYNTSGTFSASVISSYAYISGGGSSEFYYAPAYSDGRHGVYYLFNDKAIYNGEEGSWDDDWLYYGRAFSVSIRLSSAFADYNGYAKLQYTHTWKSGTITGINYGSNGFVPVIKYPEYSFTVESGSDSKF